MVGAKNVSAHSLRKHFQNTLETPELHIQKTWIKQMMGKKFNPGDAPYVEHRTEKLFEAYKRAYQKLRLIEKWIVSEGDRRIITAIDNLRMSGHFPEERLNIIHTLNQSLG